VEAFNLYPNETSLRLAWHYLKSREIEKQDTMNKADVEKVKEKIWNIYNAITTEVFFDPRVNAYCNWCEIKSECPLMIAKANREDGGIFMKIPSGK
jgi:hypothetical protein